MSELEKISELLKQKKTGSDYTATVTSVKDGIAYVKMEGSDIADTPVKLTIGAKPGDTVKVRVANGQAWITGNLTEPPTNDEKKVRQVQNMATHIREMANKVIIAVGGKMDKDMKNRPSSIVIDSGKIKFQANSIVIDSDNFKLLEDGDAVFSGTLSAAGGTFDGAVTFSHTYREISDYSQTVKIGSPDAAAPIAIDAPYGDNMTVGIDIAAGYILLGRQAPIGQSGSKFTQITPDGVTTFSDRRLKDDIVDLDESIGLRLKPVEYRFKGDPDPSKHYGFIAQDVEDIIPGAVQTGPKGYLSLSYLEFIAPTLALAQKNAERIKQLEQEIAELRNIRNEVNDGK